MFTTLYTLRGSSGKSKSCWFWHCPNTVTAKVCLSSHWQPVVPFQCPFRMSHSAKPLETRTVKQLLRKKNCLCPFLSNAPSTCDPCFSRGCVSLVYLRQPTIFTLLIAKLSWMWAVLKYQYIKVTIYMMSLLKQSLWSHQVCFTVFVEIKDSDLSLCV